MNIKLLLLTSLIVFSCKKETTIKEKTCNCYERHEAFDTYAKPNGLAGAGWMFKYNTTKAPDLCEKETGVWVYSGNPTNKRYLVICN